MKQKKQKKIKDENIRYCKKINAFLILGFILNILFFGFLTFTGIENSNSILSIFKVIMFAMFIFIIISIILNIAYYLLIKNYFTNYFQPFSETASIEICDIEKLKNSNDYICHLKNDEKFSLQATFQNIVEIQDDFSNQVKEKRSRLLFLNKKINKSNERRFKKKNFNPLKYKTIDGLKEETYLSDVNGICIANIYSYDYSSALNFIIFDFNNSKFNFENKKETVIKFIYTK